MDFNRQPPDDPETGGSSLEQTERKAMIFLLILGVILLTGGLLFAWKIGAFDISYFYGLKEGSFNYIHRGTYSRGLLLFHIPWIAGGWLIRNAVEYFLKRTK